MARVATAVARILFITLFSSGDRGVLQPETTRTRR
jgi:hypothetical protein